MYVVRIIQMDESMKRMKNEASRFTSADSRSSRLVVIINSHL